MKITKEMGCYFSSGLLKLEEDVPQEVVKDYRKKVVEVARELVKRNISSPLLFIDNIRADKYAKSQLGLPTESNLEDLLKGAYKKNNELVEGHIGKYKYGTILGKRTYDAFIKNLHEELPRRADGKDYKFDLVLMK